MGEALFDPKLLRGKVRNLETAGFFPKSISTRLVFTASSSTYLYLNTID